MFFSSFCSYYRACDHENSPIRDLNNTLTFCAGPLPSIYKGENICVTTSLRGISIGS